MYPAGKPKRVVSAKEIILIVLFFGTILGLLHSKDLFQRLLLSEKSNYDLTEAYLRNLVRIKPDDTEMLYEFAKVLIHQGKYDLAETMLSALESSKNSAMRTKALDLRYALLKQRLNVTKDPKERARIREALHEALVYLTAKPMSGKALRKWLAESRAAGDREVTLALLKRLAQEKPGNVAVFEEVYREAVNANDTKTAAWAMEKLYAGREIWLKNYVKNPKVYRQNVDLLIAYLLKRDRNIEASDLALGLYRFEKKRKDLFHALDYLVWGGHYERAVDLARRYEKVLTKDRAGAKKVLELYLAAGKTKEARRLSLELLKRVKQ